VGAGHHEQHREQAADGHELERRDAALLLVRATGGGGDPRLVRLVEEAGHVPRVDRRR
jgi:hypothetical protein